jgi:FMN phosphatase YigB (HAD superfamily)
LIALIIFDLDDTLLDTSGSITPYKLREFLRFLERSLYCDRGTTFLPSFDVAYLELLKFNSQCESSKEAVRLTLERHRAMHLYEEALALFTAPLPKDFTISTTPHAKNVLLSLRERGYLIALVTSGKRDFQLQKLEISGLEPSIFSKIVIPEDSIKKPYYEALLREFLERPYDGIVVGDRIPIDLAPAHELGFRTVHMQWGRGMIWKSEPWIDHSIRELSELLEWV